MIIPQIGVDLDGEAGFDQFGISTGISSNGNRVVVGARHNDGGGNVAGHVQAFEFDGTNYVKLGKL